MAPPSSNENQGKEDGKTNDDSNSSWFGSWFERDMRNEIHEQLNAFDKKKQRYEEAQEQRRRFFEQHASSSFPFFFPHENDNHHNPHGSGGPERSETNNRRQEFEDFISGFPGPRWQGGFYGDESEDGRRRRRGDPFESDGNDNNGQAQRDETIEDLHREIQNLFEAAYAGGMMPPLHGSGHQHGGGNRGWSSSSSTTVISNSNGTSYTMKQDSRNGARVDLQLPKDCPAEKVSVEVVQESPCLFRWRNKDSEFDDMKGSSRRNNQLGKILELGDWVDCSKLSASVSKARQTLTVEAPPIGRVGSELEPLLSSQSQQPNSYPRSVPITKKA